MKRFVFLAILAATVGFAAPSAARAEEAPTAIADNAEPDPAKLAAATEELVAASAETDSPIAYDSQDEESSGWSGWFFVRWFMRLFGWAQMFGLTGGLTLFAFISSAFAACMVAFGKGMIAMFNFLDRLTSPAPDATRDRMDAILNRSQPARR